MPNNNKKKKKTEYKDSNSDHNEISAEAQLFHTFRVCSSEGASNFFIIGGSRELDENKNTSTTCSYCIVTTSGCSVQLWSMNGVLLGGLAKDRDGSWGIKLQDTDPMKYLTHTAPRTSDAQESEQFDKRKKVITIQEEQCTFPLPEKHCESQCETTSSSCFDLEAQEFKKSLRHDLLKLRDRVLRQSPTLRAPTPACAEYKPYSYTTLLQQYSPPASSVSRPLHTLYAVAHRVKNKMKGALAAEKEMTLLGGSAAASVIATGSSKRGSNLKVSVVEPSPTIENTTQVDQPTANMSTSESMPADTLDGEGDQQALLSEPERSYSMCQKLLLCPDYVATTKSDAADSVYAPQYRGVVHSTNKEFREFLMTAGAKSRLPSLRPPPTSKFDRRKTSNQFTPNMSDNLSTGSTRGRVAGTRPVDGSVHHLPPVHYRKLFSEAMEVTCPEDDTMLFTTTSKIPAVR